MQDKKLIKLEIITYLCGDNDLSPKFIKLLKAGDLTEEDGKIIQDRLIYNIYSDYNIDLLFEEFYRDQLKSRDDYPVDEIKEYTGDNEYLELLDKHFPQTVSEAIDIIIGRLDIEDIRKIKKQDKSEFTSYQHFGLGLFMRNHFGINLQQSKTLYSDILERSGKTFYMSDDISGYLLEEIWDEIQKRDFDY